MRAYANGREVAAAAAIAERVAIRDGIMYLIRDIATDDGRLQCQAASFNDSDARNGHSPVTWYDVQEGELYSRLPTFMKVAPING